MSATKSTPDNLRGWVRPCKAYPSAWQRAELEAAGAGVIYEHNRDGETIAELIRSVVDGDTVLVTTAARLGYSYAAVGRAILAIHAKGAHVMETETKLRSDRPKQWLKADAAIQHELNRERRTLSEREAREFGARGGAARAEQAAITPKLMREMKAIWRDRNSHGTTAEACEAVRKLIAPRQASDRTIARWLGRRSKGGGGRPRKSVVELASEFVEATRPKRRKK